jgi:hypothetical protein
LLVCIHLANLPEYPEPRTVAQSLAVNLTSI